MLSAELKEEFISMHFLRFLEWISCSLRYPSANSWFEWGAGISFVGFSSVDVWDLVFVFYQYCSVIVWIVKSMIRNRNQFFLQFFKVCPNPVIIMLNAWNWVQKLGQESDCNVFSLVCMINFMFAEVPSLWFYQYYSFLVGVHNYMTREWKQFCLWFCLYTLIYQSWSKPCGNYELKIEGGVYCPVFSLVCTINFVGIFLIPCSDWQFHDKG